MSQDPSQERKIIIDEDWKAQVEREREEARSQSEQVEPQPTQSPDASGSEPLDYSQLPPPSFSFLVSSLAAQAMSALGQLPDPVSGKPEIRLPLAQHHIETLAMLEEKTKGNVTEVEAGQLEGTLHDLRMLYVMVQKQHPQQDR
jgi:hypothetical protein